MPGLQQLLGAELGDDKVDYYKLLGLKANATKAQVKKAYHNAVQSACSMHVVFTSLVLQARKFHPDKAPGNNMSRVEAEILFRNIAEAHEVLIARRLPAAR